VISQEAGYVPIAAPVVAAATVAAASTRDSSGDREYESEQVREYEPPAALVSETPPSGPGVAAATPVKIEWPSDLQQVESDPTKVTSSAQGMDAEAPAPRPKRVRPAQQAVDEGPLVQIETDSTKEPAPR
jgi:hypothetical protein